VHGQNRALAKLFLETKSNYFIVLFYKRNAIHEIIIIIIIM